MKQKISAILVTLAMAAGLCLPAAAAPPVDTGMTLTTASSQIGIQWVSTSMVSHGISIDSGGKSVSSVSYTLSNQRHKVNLSVTLQKMSGASFSNYAGPWTASGTGNLFFSKTYYVTRGTYRIKTVGNVYDQNGKFVETVTLYSSSQTY